MSSLPCFEYLCDQTRLLTRCMEWISTTRKIWYHGKRLPPQLYGAQLESYAISYGTAFVRSIEHSPTGIPLVGRILYSLSNQGFYASFVAASEDETCEESFRPLPEPVDGVYLVKEENKQCGLYEGYSEHVTPNIMRWCIQQGWLNLEDTNITHSCVRDRRWDLLDILREEYQARVDQRIMVEFCFRSGNYKNRGIDTRTYFLYHQPDDFLELLQHRCHLESFFRDILDEADIKHSAGDYDLLAELVTLYYSRRNKVEVLEKFLVCPERKILLSGDLAQKLNIEGPQVGGVTKAAR